MHLLRCNVLPLFSTVAHVSVQVGPNFIGEVQVRLPCKVGNKTNSETTTLSQAVRRILERLGNTRLQSSWTMVEWWTRIHVGSFIDQIENKLSIRDAVVVLTIFVVGWLL